MDLSTLKERFSKNKSGQFVWVPLGNAHAPYKPIEGYPFLDPAYRGPFQRYSFWGNAHYYYNYKLYRPDPDNEIVYIGKKKKKTVIDELQADFSSQNFLKITDQDIQYVIDLYDQSILLADSEVGRIIDILKENNIYDNTIIIIQTEHGEDFNEHKYIAHYDIFDTTTHVPLIFKPLGHNSSDANKEEDAMVSGIDVLPSLVSYLKLNTQADFTGRNDIFLNREKLAKNTEVYISRTPIWETALGFKDNSFYDQLRYENQNGIYADFSIRNQNWKIIHRRSRLIMSKFSYWQILSGEKNDTPEYEIYDLQKDSTEQKILKNWNTETIELKNKLLSWEKYMFQQTKTGKKIYELQEYR